MHARHRPKATTGGFSPRSPLLSVRFSPDGHVSRKWPDEGVIQCVSLARARGCSKDLTSRVYNVRQWTIPYKTRAIPGSAAAAAS